MTSSAYIPFARIVEAVCDDLGLPRTAAIVPPGHNALRMQGIVLGLIATIARYSGHYSYPDIAREMGRSSHSAIIDLVRATSLDPLTNHMACAIYGRLLRAAADNYRSPATWPLRPVCRVPLFAPSRHSATSSSATGPLGHSATRPLPGGHLATRPLLPDFRGGVAHD